MRETSEGRLWNEFVARRLQELVGAQMRYAVHDRDDRPLAMLDYKQRRVEAHRARQLHRMDVAGASTS